MGVHFIKVPVTLTIGIPDGMPITDEQVVSAVGGQFMALVHTAIAAGLLPVDGVEYRGSDAVPMTEEEFSIEALEMVANGADF